MTTASDCKIVMSREYLERIGRLSLWGELLNAGFGLIDEHELIALTNLGLEGNGPVVFHGPIAFVERLSRSHQCIPGAYFDRERFRTIHYRAHMPADWFLNSDVFYVPFSDLNRQSERLFSAFGVDSLFVRPDSGSKVFTGFCISRDSLAFELSSLIQITSVTNTTLLQVSPSKPIEAEFRFFIANRKVVSSTAYSFDPGKAKSCRPPQQAIDLAEMVAIHRWQVDVAYTCDIAISAGKALIVELNAFSTSGMYDAAPIDVFRAISECAALEFDGEISVES